jgi:hypothetical protein
MCRSHRSRSRGQPIPNADEIAKKNAWRNGFWIVEAENFLDPGPRIAKVVNGQPVNELPAKVDQRSHFSTNPEIWGIVNVHAYAYQNETFGVNFGFDGFCFTREGETIGSSGPRSAAQMFGSVAGTVPQSTVGQVAPPVPSPAQSIMPNGAVLPPAAPPAPVAAPPSPPLAPAAPPPPPAPAMAPAGLAGLPPIPGR